MPDSSQSGSVYVVRVCPSCGGQNDAGSQTHIGDCSERGYAFVALREIEVAPVGSMFEIARRSSHLQDALAKANRALCEARNCLSPGMRAGTSEAIQILDEAAQASSDALDKDRHAKPTRDITDVFRSDEAMQAFGVQRGERRDT